MLVCTEGHAQAIPNDDDLLLLKGRGRKEIIERLTQVFFTNTAKLQ